MLKLFKNYDNLIFDLDNTLYPENRYLDGAYKNIANFLANFEKMVRKIVISGICLQ